jgi:hypothetical protein
MSGLDSKSKLVMTDLVIAAGLDVQHSCAACGVLLDAYSREPAPGRWVCPDHESLAVNSSGPDSVTCADKYEAGA